ncbi:MAG: sulfoxide reductase heme-binding subunit YedZ [Candidatus Rokubacteria bacterium]|nr:sulfoxide reductase heme-binding subunit YedZ [Candidatus Rokubacteria bacterium]
MTRRGRILLKTLVWGACLVPLALLAWRAWTGDLTANPIDFVTDTLGRWGMRMLLASLALTPLRLVLGIGWPLILRRLLGLFAFFYVSLHFLVWVVLDHFFAWAQMGADIVKRPYITVGVSALALLVLLAATSTSGMVKRLGARAWRRLHRIVYVAAVLGVLHFMWLAKVGRIEPYVYAAILAVLLGVRLAGAVRAFRVRRRGTRAGVTSESSSDNRPPRRSIVARTEIMGGPDMAPDHRTKGADAPLGLPRPPALGAVPGGARTHPRNPGRPSRARFVQGR